MATHRRDLWPIFQPGEVGSMGVTRTSRRVGESPMIAVVCAGPSLGMSVANDAASLTLPTPTTLPVRRVESARARLRDRIVGEGS